MGNIEKHFVECVIQRMGSFYFAFKYLLFHLPVAVVTAFMYFRCAIVLLGQKKNNRRFFLNLAFFLLWLFWVITLLPYAIGEFFIKYFGYEYFRRYFGTSSDLMYSQIANTIDPGFSVSRK